jgi:2,3-bisphosphoglycerate-dependent phosphoglycerate mutase
MQLYFIRHAQSQNNALWAQTGSSEERYDDPELSDLGEKQARLLASFLYKVGSEDAVGYDFQNALGFGITHLYSSLMVRAVATGTVVSRELGIPLHGWMDVHETGGIYLKNRETGIREGRPGKNRRYFADQYPDFVVPDDISAEGWWNRPFEVDEEIVPRARRVLATLKQKHGETEDRVAIISHAGFYNAFMAAFLNLPLDQKIWFSVNNTSITRFDFRENGAYVVYTNRLDFLPRELIT